MANPATKICGTVYMVLDHTAGAAKGKSVASIAGVGARDGMVLGGDQSGKANAKTAKIHR